MIYVESPERIPPTEYSLFLAGGITGCPDWQEEMVKRFWDTDWTLFNPRRRDFPIHDPDSARSQIQWEFEHLRFADAILFWFPAETLCPIVLYELGAWSMTDKPIFIGVHPDYPRRRDVEMQTALARPDVRIVYTLEDLATQVIGGRNARTT